MYSIRYSNRTAKVGSIYGDQTAQSFSGDRRGQDLYGRGTARERDAGGDLDADPTARRRGRPAAVYAHAAPRDPDRGGRVPARPGTKDTPRTRHGARRDRRTRRRRTRPSADRLGVGGVCDAAAAADFAAACSEKFPNSELTRYRRERARRLVDKIMHGEIDIAFVSLPVDNSNDHDRICCFSDEIVAIAHPKHPLAKEKFISAAALAGEKLILGERGGNTRRMIDDFFNAANVAEHHRWSFRGRKRSTRWSRTTSASASPEPRSIADEIRDGRLVSWMIEGAEIKWELGLARLRGGYFSPIAKEFVRLCKESFVEREKELKARESRLTAETQRSRDERR